MSTALLLVLDWASAPTLAGQTLADVYGVGTGNVITFNGDPDGGVCEQFENDGKDITVDDAPGAGMSANGRYFADDGFTIPFTATINTVQLIANLYGTNIDLTSPGLGPYLRSADSLINVPFTVGALSGVYSELKTDVMTVNPVTGLAWLRAELFNDGDAGFFGNGGWQTSIAVLGAGAFLGSDYYTLLVDYTATSGDIEAEVPAMAVAPVFSPVPTTDFQSATTETVAPTFSLVGSTHEMAGDVTLVPGTLGIGIYAAGSTPGVPIVMPGPVGSGGGRLGSGSANPVPGVSATATWWGLMRFDLKARNEGDL